MKHQRVIKTKKYDIEKSKTIDKYALIKRCHYDRQPRFYMFAFVYVYPETMVEEEYFPATKNIVENYNKMSTPGPVPKHWLVFSYICS